MVCFYMRATQAFNGLTDKKQSGLISDFNSTISTITSGVPQGSVRTTTFPYIHK